VDLSGSCRARCSIPPICRYGYLSQLARKLQQLAPGWGREWRTSKVLSRPWEPPTTNQSVSCHESNTFGRAARQIFFWCGCGATGAMLGVDARWSPVSPCLSVALSGPFFCDRNCADQPTARALQLGVYPNRVMAKAARLDRRPGRPITATLHAWQSVWTRPYKSRRPSVHAAMFERGRHPKPFTLMHGSNADRHRPARSRMSKRCSGQDRRSRGLFSVQGTACSTKAK
jgi:hypothetical protein